MLLGPREASLSFNPKQDVQTTRRADVHRREASEMTGQQAPPPSVSVGRFLSSLRGPLATPRPCRLAKGAVQL